MGCKLLETGVGAGKISLKANQNEYRMGYNRKSTGRSCLLSN